MMSDENGGKRASADRREHAASNWFSTRYNPQNQKFRYNEESLPGLTESVAPRAWPGWPRYIAERS
jgi:hypothetical protein